MKISSGHNELLIDVYPRFLFRAWGLLFIIVTLFFLFPLLVQHHISCKEKGAKYTNSCTLRTSVLMLYNRSIFLGQLKSATLSNYAEDREDSIYYYLLLSTTEGYIKIPNIRSKKSADIVSIADAIDAYISNSEDKSFSIPKIESWWSDIKILIFGLIGFGSFLFRLITIRFNKKADSIIIAAKNIINSHETIISIADVDKLIVEEHGENHKEYSLALILKNGEEVHLPGVHDSSKKHIEDIARHISPFLKR